jgi:hypothetical protein
MPSAVACLPISGVCARPQGLDTRLPGLEDPARDDRTGCLLWISYSRMGDVCSPESEIEVNPGSHIWSWACQRLGAGRGWLAAGQGDPIAQILCGWFECACLRPEGSKHLKEIEALLLLLRSLLPAGHLFGIVDALVFQLGAVVKRVRGLCCRRGVSPSGVCGSGVGRNTGLT